MTNLELTYAPMEAQLVTAIPDGDDWQFEPKWDGFRCLAHRSGDKIDLISKSGQPLGRYFPEIVATLKTLKAENFVIDGELVVPEGKSLSFDKLLQRIHPAESRIKKLSIETPATFILFDILVTDRLQNVTDKPLTERRPLLEKFAAKYLSGLKNIVVTPMTLDRDVANEWLAKEKVVLDGVIAKRTSLPYQSGNRDGMVKVKRKRTADCVIGGFRYGTNSKVVGSLLLGLYDSEGELHHVGFTSGMAGIDKKALTKQLEDLATEKSFTKNLPGGPSRWSTARSVEWQPIKPELVLEVQFDHLTNGRFRHGTRILRWRPDKAPSQCTFDQLGTEHDSASAGIVPGSSRK